MLIVTYDISNDKLRTQFSKLLEQYGRRLQYSVFEITNSKRIIRLLTGKIEHKFSKQFEMSDSILIFPVCAGCADKTIRYGRPVQEEGDLVVI